MQATLQLLARKMPLGDIVAIAMSRFRPMTEYNCKK